MKGEARPGVDVVTGVPMLNVGCGSDIRPGWVNKDLPEFDAGKRPWPWPDATFSHVHMGCVAPHLAPSPGAMEDSLHVAITEAFRVLRPGGRLVIGAPDPRDPDWALGSVHHHRLIHPAMFSGYLSRKARQTRAGVKLAVGGPFTSMKVEWGLYGKKPRHLRDAAGRPLGVSKFARNWFSVGRFKLGLLTHVFRRLRFTWFLRGQKIRVTLTK